MIHLSNSSKRVDEIENQKIENRKIGSQKLEMRSLKIRNVEAQIESWNGGDEQKKFAAQHHSLQGSSWKEVLEAKYLEGS